MIFHKNDEKCGSFVKKINRNFQILFHSIKLTDNRIFNMKIIKFEEIIDVFILDFGVIAIEKLAPKKALTFCGVKFFKKH